METFCCNLTGKKKLNKFHMYVYYFYLNITIMETHLEPDILECEVKWALESITMNKASGGDEFQLNCFKS